ncbi:hypothetical protein DICPUDRAFT_57189 [Dictyostelium purpureum]|uniref:HECT-type E3 ubiquitin transferase n=1 Tax=Dictyostelium purpureum TaxID=5786 RepID=F0ZUU2_DICPU|nr:uncharacterized protein DICPUDRAFT_57189 [Dictyostelium purpureum]EGC32277.1 hypothetical protein DICPUDRAFT_57189 [Dictyostelium purpureum]|eukprot:XP_003291186.1 hypothetical protein DICPUDRAFT_57189 [Dictyostelium purpureum]
MRNLSGALLDELQTPLRGGNPAAVGLLNTLIEGRNRSKLLLQGLKSDDENKQMESLLEVCDLLSIATEETIAGFPSDSFAPALINLLNMDHNPDMMLLAGRALSNMIEALPSSISSVVNHGAVSILCSKLLSIEYIDLAEQCLQTLEKISQEQPTVVLRAGGLMATLSFIDFFSTGVQRMAITTASNICRQVPKDCFDMVREPIQILTNLLQYQDQKVVELSCLCFSRLIESFYDSPQKLEIIASHGLISNLVRIISGMYNSTTSLSPNTYSQIIRIMATVCHGCPNITQTLLEEGIISIIQSIMYPSNDNANGSNSNVNRNSQQCYEVLSLINELLPPLPQEFANLLTPNRSIPNSLQSPELLKTLGEDLFVVLVEMFTSNVNTSVRYKSLGCICKVLYYSSSEQIKDLLKEFAFSSFLASLLGSRDMIIVATAIKIVELMMERLPVIFDRYFKREGVVYEVDRLSKLEQPSPPQIPSSLSTSSSLPSTPSSASTATSTTTTIIPTTQEELKSFVCKEAKKLKDTYFPKLQTMMGATNENFSTKELSILKNLSQKLNKCEKEEGVEILEEIKSLLIDTEGISAFEFLHSDLVGSILNYLTRGNIKKHAECFAKVFLVPYQKSGASSMTPLKTSSPNPLLLSLLIEKLHDALNKVERFNINISDVSGTSSGLKYLTQPFKLKLQKEGTDPNLKDYSGNIVLIEPLANITAIEEFLNSKVIVTPNLASAVPASLSCTTTTVGLTTTTSNTNKDGTTEKPVEKEKDSIMDEDDEDEEDTPPTANTSPTASTSTTATGSTTKTPSKLGIFVDGQRLTNSITIFQAVQRIARVQQIATLNSNNNNNNNNDYESSLNVQTNRLWDSTHPPIRELGSSKLIDFLTDDHSFQLTSNDTATYEILSLLRCLYMFNLDPASVNAGSILSNSSMILSSASLFTSERSLLNASEFISQKLTAKIMRQLQDPLALCGGVFPDWCKQLLNSCSFLFPFDCKRLFFYSTSFGIARALSTLQQRQDLIRQTNGSAVSSNNDRGGDFRVGRIQRQKVRIYRNKILESAIKVMDLYGKSKSMLEVEYFGEAGTGLGPTLEFFTLVSKEIQRKDLNLWYTDNTTTTTTTIISEPEKMEIDSLSSPSSSKTPTTPTTTEIIHEYIYCPGGLFPRPINPSTTIDKKLLDYFKFLGSFIAKTFFDQRLIDLPLSKPFYKYMIEQELEFEDLRQLSPAYASSLNNLYSLVLRIKEIKSKSDLSDTQKKEEIDQLRIEGAKIEDLCLDFTLPGFQGWELKEGGENIPVTLENLEEYLNLIVKNFLYDGVIRQFNSFKEGFNQTFSISSLKPFTIAEVESLLCGSLTGSDSDWSIESLMESTKADHGYTLQSKSVQNIFQIMSEFTPEQRKQFLLFISGSPHLPLQGFKGLIPRLTIVKKHHFPPLTPDDYLLSVMSCTNYIKLPDYSNKEVMKEKLLYAMNEGQSSFHLS